MPARGLNSVRWLETEATRLSVKLVTPQKIYMLRQDNGKANYIYLKKYLLSDLLSNIIGILRKNYK